jgi:succinate dehydrogenase flavin-adding protein (antitoxin of CptAB toxin-antitoxin module)
MEKVNKELIVKELKSLSDKEIDVLYSFLEPLITELTLEEVKDWEDILNVLDNKELINE